MAKTSAATPGSSPGALEARGARSKQSSHRGLPRIGARPRRTSEANMPRTSPTPAHGTVVAYLALFVALSGTSYAAVTLSKNSVRSSHIKNGQVKRADLADRAVD